MLFRFIFVLLLLSCSLSKTYAAWCHDECSNSCTKDYVKDNTSTSAKDATSQDGGSWYACNDVYKQHDQDTKYRIGWGDTCATPSGDNAVNGATCLTTHNLLGQLLDVFLTFGIAEAMFKQFCSFSAGDPALEGGIISKSVLESCQNEPTAKKRKKCMSCLLRGLSYNGSGSLNECVASGGTTHAIDLSQLPNTKPNAKSPNIESQANFCNGIPNTDRPLVVNGKTAVYKGTVVYCPMMRCNIPTNYIRTKYYDERDTRVEIIGGLAAGAAAATGGLGLTIGGIMLIMAGLTPDCCDIDSVTEGNHEHVGYWGAVNLKGTHDGDRICAEMLMPANYTAVACKFRVPPVVTYPQPKCTLAGTSCTSGKNASPKHALWVMPLTSTLMECVHDVIGLFFEPQMGTSSTCPTNHLFLFQSNLRNIVKILLVLYVIVYGLNLVIGGGNIKKGEIFSFIFKFALVTYFSVGTFDSTPLGGGDFNQQQAQSVNKNGLEVIREVAFAGMNNFSLWVINAAGSSKNPEKAKDGGLTRPCNFNATDSKYIDTETGKNYGYLALWDAIDCHLTFYLGLAAPTTLGLQNAKYGTAGIIVTDMVGGVLAMIFPAFLSIEMLLMIFALALTIFLFSIVVYFTNLYIVAMLAVTVLIFFGPFFIPMSLFSYTRSMFDQWTKLLFGYALQPLIISGFIALFITTFHFVFYTGCTFTKPSDLAAFPYWVFETPVSSICKNSFGYLMSEFNPTVALQRVSFGGGMFYYNTFAHHFEETVETAFDGMMLCTFFAFLFYYFAEQLSALAADLTGSMQLGSTISPNAITNLALKKLTSGVTKKIPDQAKQKAKRPNVQVNAADDKSGGGVDVGGSSRAGLKVSESPDASSASASRSAGASGRRLRFKKGVSRFSSGFGSRFAAPKIKSAKLSGGATPVAKPSTAAAGGTVPVTKPPAIAAAGGGTKATRSGQTFSDKRKASLAAKARAAKRSTSSTSVGKKKRK